MNKVEIPQTETYQGLDSVEEFVNEDGKNPDYNCGQAAIASLVHHYGISVTMEEVEKWYPPNVLFGYLGTSRKRIEKGLIGYGGRPSIVEGVEEVKRNLRHKRPGIVIYQFDWKKILNITIPSGHWMMAFGYDEDYIYVTNWTDNRIDWETFQEGWKGLIPDTISMDETMILFEDRVLT